MKITLTLTEKEKTFLEKLMNEYRKPYNRGFTLEDAVHECIRDSMFDEGEESAPEEF